MANYIKEIRKKIGHDAIFMPAVGAIIYQDGKILLQKRQDNEKWAIHGGAIELGESCLQALERELKEEINIKPIQPKLFGVYAGEDFYNEYSNGDKIYELLTVFWVESYEGNLQEDNEEVTELKWFSIENLPGEIHAPNIPVMKDLKIFLKNGDVRIN